MKHFLLLVAMLFFAVPVHAAEPVAVSGDLIKASGQTIYYLGANGKRYVFPTEKTYFSWYSDFSTVKTVSDAELSSYSLGGNVTYKPGIRLVKVTTDPKVYAVARNGSLRWVESEAVASGLFGANWARQIDDIPDAFFINYRMGSSITSTADYSPSIETLAAASINADKNLGIQTVAENQAMPTQQSNESTNQNQQQQTSTEPQSGSNQNNQTSQQQSYTIEVFSPSPGLGLGRQYTAISAENAQHIASNDPGNWMSDSNQIVLGAVIRDAAGNNAETANSRSDVMTITATDGSQNKVISGTSDYRAGVGYYYSFTYLFYSTGTHTITFSGKGAGQNVNLEAR